MAQQHATQARRAARYRPSSTGLISRKEIEPVACEPLGIERVSGCLTCTDTCLRVTAIVHEPRVRDR
jgi:hypothetical protein